MKKFAVTGLYLTILFGTNFRANADNHFSSASVGGLSFIENKGQWEPEIRYKTEIPGGAMFLTDKGFVYNYVNVRDLARIEQSGDQKNRDTEIVSYHAYQVKFNGCDPAAMYAASSKKSTYRNYFVGKDSSRWKGNVGLYETLFRRNIYKGIDLKIYSENQGLKYDFIVSPGADPGHIRLSFDGVNPEINETGDLVIRTSVNTVIEKAPYCYQEIGGKHITVASKYQLKNSELTFVFPDGYDKRYPLTIDPELIFATYSGATSTSVYAHATTYDKEGNLYAAANAWTTGWPVSLGAFQTTYGGGTSESAINKYSPDGTQLIYSTYLGGSRADYPHAMRVNESGELVVVGSTQSSDFPVTANAYQSNFTGAWDLFITRFSADGSALVGSTYLGGSGFELQNFYLSNVIYVHVLTNHPPGITSSSMDLVFDKDDNVWVTGNTNSTNFPTTPNAQQAVLTGKVNGVLFKLNRTCSNLMYSSYLGGSTFDTPTSIIFNNAGNLVVGGITQSTDFPTTAGTMMPTVPDGNDVDGFVTIIDPLTGNILQSSFVGTKRLDNVVGLQVNCDDEIYILGRTLGHYPISSGAWTTRSDGDVFIDKVTPDLSASIVSTRLGNSQSQTQRIFFPSGFTVDKCGRVYLSGFNALDSLPVTPDAFQKESAYLWFCVLEPDFSEVNYATYFGVVGDNTHVGVHRIDPKGMIYHSSTTHQNNRLVTPNAWSSTKQTLGNDVYSFKFDLFIPPIDVSNTSGDGTNDTTAHCVRGCKSAYFNFSRKKTDSMPQTIRFHIGGSAINGQDYKWIADSIVIPANDTTVSLEIKPLLTSEMPTGVKDVTLTILNPCVCGDEVGDTIAVKTILIYDSLFVNIPTPPTTTCPNTPIEITGVIDPNLSFEWQPAALIPDPRPFGLTIHPAPVVTTTYTLTVRQPGAPATCPPNSKSFTATVEPYPQITLSYPDSIRCLSLNDSVDLAVFVEPEGIDYQFNWTPASNLNNDYLSWNRFSAPPGSYTYKITVSTPLAKCKGEDSMTIHVDDAFKIASVSPVDTTIELGDVVQLKAEGDAIFWVWSPPTYLDNPTLQDPKSSPAENITYQLIAIGPGECKDTTQVKINVTYRSNIFIPSAFSPNGDALNDIFKVENIRYEHLLALRIFNRYGQLVFESQNDKKGWDGTIQGEPAEAGTYFYLIKIKVPFEDNIRTYKGDITLLR